MMQKPNFQLRCLLMIIIIFSDYSDTINGESLHFVENNKRLCVPTVFTVFINELVNENFILRSEFLFRTQIRYTVQ